MTNQEATDKVVNCFDDTLKLLKLLSEKVNEIEKKFDDYIKKLDADFIDLRKKVEDRK